jgi:hypothetical protein
MWRGIGLVVVGVMTAAGAAGCTIELPARECNESTDCVRGGVPGECLPSPTSESTWCAFPSTECTSGMAFGSRAGDGLAGQCVVASEADAGIDAEIPDAGPDAPPDACVPMIEVCDGIDNDCNGSTDEGCPEVVELRFPWNGYATGSVWATAASLGVKPRRPTFKWAAAAGGMNYQLQVDDSCTTPDFAACGFSSPELDLSVTALSAISEADLPVSTMAPVGRRYYWRVRACNSVGCGAWSAVRYLDVGRLPNDFNGDGYGDIAVGAPGSDTTGVNAGAVYVCFGSASPSLDCAVGLTLNGAAADERLGAAVSAVGDVNADGFADLLVGADRSDVGGLDLGAAFLFLGGSVVDATPDVTFMGETTLGYFGQRLAAAGDLNGDGFRDMAIAAQAYGAPGSDGLGRVYVYFGASSGSIDPTADGIVTGEAPGDELGWGLGAPGDVNGDGFGDLLIGAPNSDGAGTSGALSGRVYLYTGGAGSSFDSVSDWMVSGATGMMLGNAVTGCDVNGDGFSDVIVGEYWNEGQFHVYIGDPTMGMTPDATVVGLAGSSDHFGQAIACTDMNADGFADLAVSGPGNSLNRGRAVVYFGVPGAFNVVNDGIFWGEVEGDYFGFSAAAAGDVTGDGYGDVAVGAFFFDGGGPSTDNRGRTYVFFGAATIFADSTVDTRITGAAGDTCAFTGGGAF